MSLGEMRRERRREARRGDEGILWLTESGSPAHRKGPVS